MTSVNSGVCDIKKEYVLKKEEKIVNDDGVNKRKISESDEFEAKKTKTDNNKEEASRCKRKGQNKARPKTFQDDKQNKPCPSIVNLISKDELKPCQFNNCKYIHNPLDYIKSKLPDLGNDCHLYNTRGRCPRGISCRYGSSHITDEGFNIVDEEKASKWKEDTKNTLQHSIQILLQKRKYDFSLSENLVKSLDIRKKKQINNPSNDSINSEELNEYNHKIGPVLDEDIVKLLPRERKKINWTDKLYLSPLTTVGNLPFRRICKEYGADITCGEMALCESLLKGMKQEWALVKRHESEDLFGAQICGNNAYAIGKVSQLLKENTELDFIDLNLGCPIDLVYKKGGGSGMMHRIPALELSVKSASQILDIPFTIKMRTGVYQDKKIAHTIIPKVVDWGASLITLHGRSREARYTRLADWEYIEVCAKAASPCPVYGNGDILSYEDYVNSRKTAPNIQGVMIGRGALIKPWIFNEIKEQKLYDISSHERFEIIKKFTKFGLEHWGSDTQGVENTRRFLLEWLSFLYRYIPVGLLERPPQKINERPPLYFGRNDLETLMASGNCADWVKISEMVLGPVPDGFKFLPKHKANSY